MTLFLICLFCWLVMGICGCSIVFYKNREDLLEAWLSCFKNELKDIIIAICFGILKLFY